MATNQPLIAQGLEGQLPVGFAGILRHVFAAFAASELNNVMDARPVPEMRFTL